MNDDFVAFSLFLTIKSAYYEINTVGCIYVSNKKFTFPRDESNKAYYQDYLYFCAKKISQIGY